ncbi:MAG TPA: tRNA (adenosine(37)-N6)-threonylcarbamoyltransferase complex dimerization subunit type 1 TsaB [Candidatus Fraserbacteria bacterium]|nr:tRNA (adenosine(37)-N6)-threonylcarbamoyltransferase complex dimerization subunit type 1 TsaB [Candidatus Fraserbacteria bacterium]
MLTLGIETAGEQAAVGLCRNGRDLTELGFAAERRQGEKLLEAITAALNWGQVDRSQLELIAVSAGPGSFTGLRIGLAMAKGLARALEIPLVGVPTLWAYAQPVCLWSGPVYALLPDRRDWVYWAGYRGGELLAEGGAQPIGSLLAALSEKQAKEPPLLIGPGAERHRPLIEGQAGDQIVAPARLNWPSGLQVARLGLAAYREQGQDQRETLEPLYMRAPLA